MIADSKRKPQQNEGNGDKRRRQEEALDEALKNTFLRPILFQSSSRRRPGAPVLSMKRRDTAEQRRGSEPQH
jgi:hypothetical protein